MNHLLHELDDFYAAKLGWLVLPAVVKNFGTLDTYTEEKQNTNHIKELISQALQGLVQLR
jgi:hypothetical protein